MSKSEYRRKSVPVLSSPVVDSAIIEGRARGYADGLAQARLQAQRDTERRENEHAQTVQRLNEVSQNAAASLHSAASRLSERMVESLDDVKAELFASAVEIASMILSIELSEASVAARSSIQRALNASTPSPIHTIRLNPEAHAAALDEDMDAHGITLVADPTLPPGGCIAEYQDGWLSAGIEEAMERVRGLAGNQR